MAAAVRSGQNGNVVPVFSGTMKMAIGARYWRAKGYAAVALSDQPSSKVTASLSLPLDCHSGSRDRSTNSEVCEAYLRNPANVLLRTIIPESEAVCCTSESVNTRWKVSTMVPRRRTQFLARYNKPDARNRPAQNVFPWARSADRVNGLGMVTLFKLRAVLAGEIPAPLPAWET